MEKCLICLYVPAAGEHYDVSVPLDLEIGALTNLLAKGVFEVSSGKYFRGEQMMLVLKEPEMLLHPNRTLSEYGIENGMELLLF